MSFKNNNFILDFVGIGAARSGTTWLSECLREHPQVNFSQKKEVQFFNKVGGIYDTHHKWNYKEGFDWYKQFFSKEKPECLCGEFSVDYMYDKSVAPLLYKHFPNVKVIVCLRNPIARTYSHYSFFRDRHSHLGYVQSSFEETIAREPEYLKRSMYYVQLKPYYEIFPRENICVFLYDDIKNNPSEVASSLYRFLGVDDTFVPSILHKRVNPAITPKNAFLSKIYLIPHMLRHSRFAPIIKKIGKNRLYKAISKVLWDFIYIELPRPEMSPGTKSRLFRIFKCDIEKTQELIEKDLSSWLS